MIFNMGPGKKGNPKVGGLQSFVKTLSFIFNYNEVPWGCVANEIQNSKWYGQVGGRAKRICNEIKTGTEGV